MKRTKGMGPDRVISEAIAATSSGCPNDTDHSFFSVKIDRTNPRKRADFTCPSGRGKSEVD
jgi:hypothetical protein